MCVRTIVAFLSGAICLPLILVAEGLQREIDMDGVTWLYEREVSSVIRGVEISSVIGNLRKLEFPVKLGGMPVRAISAGAFKSCEYLFEIDIPIGIESIGKEAFANCSNLVAVKMECGKNCVRSIGVGAFENCRKLEILDLPDGLECIADGAFYGCDGLKRIVLPANCTYALEGFSNCRSLKQIDIGNVFEFVENHGTFVGCVSLAEIIVPPSNGRFVVQDGILYTSDGVSLVRCPPKLANKEIKVRNGVFSICPQAFDACVARSVSLPDSLDSIGYASFRGCTNLISMTIPANVRVICQRAFAGCSNLKSVVFLGNERSVIDDDAFPPNAKLEFRNPTPQMSCDSNPYGCYQSKEGFVLRQINAMAQESCAGQFEICSLDEHYKHSGPIILKIPGVIDGCKVTHIASQAFAYNQSIVAVEIGSNVCQIGRNAFCGCSNIVSVSMSDCAFNPMGILDEAFSRCAQLADLKLPAGLKVVNRRAFAECSSLKDVHIPDSCYTMAEDAFSGCQSLRTIYIGSIGKYDDDRLLSAFLNCPSLEKISIHPDNPTYVIQDGALYYKDLKTIVRCPAKLGRKIFAINDNVEKVCPFAFEGCQFSEIILPNHLVGIGQGAFANCANLVSIIIPSGVKLIDDYAFWGNSNLVSVVMNDNQMLSVGTKVFPAHTKLVIREKDITSNGECLPPVGEVKTVE